jgi:hypothetical protein
LHHGIGRERRKIGGGFENLRGRRVPGKRRLFLWRVEGVGKKYLNRVFGRRRLGPVKVPEFVPMRDIFMCHLGFCHGTMDYSRVCHLL